MCNTQLNWAVTSISLMPAYSDKTDIKQQRLSYQFMHTSLLGKLSCFKRSGIEIHFQESSVLNRESIQLTIGEKFKFQNVWQYREA